MFKGFTKCTTRIVNYLSVLEARRYNHAIILPEHVIIALLKDSSGIAHKVIGYMLDPVQLQTLLETHLSTMIIEDETNETNKEYRDIEYFYNLDIKVTLSKRMHKCLYRAVEESRALQRDILDTFILFMACCKEKSSVLFQILQGLDISFQNLRSSYYRFTKHIMLYENNTNFDTSQEQSNTVHQQSFDASFTTLPEHDLQKALKFKEMDYQEKKPLKKNIKKTQENGSLQFLTDLTEKMFHHKTAMYGREKEIQNIFRVLMRHYKNNPLLIGEPGVGKSALVEEIARRICWGEVPLSLLHARLLQLDIASMTAGTRFRGDFEERLCKVIEYVQQQAKIAPTIVFIDEFHHLIGAGLSSGTTMDAAGILKPALARGQICCIGATTTEEYQKHIENDKAFVRRFMPIHIDELSDISTFHALKTIKKTFEKKHSVYFEDASLKEIIRLTQNYMFDRKLPDKAIDMLDEIGSFYNLQKTDSSPELMHLYKSMHLLLEKAEQSVDEFKLETSTKTGTKEAHKIEMSTSVTCDNISKTNEALHNIISRRTSLQNALKVLLKNSKVRITTKHVQNVISDIMNIPSDRINTEQISFLKTLPHNLKKHVIGQDRAIDALVSAIQRSAVGLRDEKRPIGSFLFLGSTGVGKTYTAVELAKHWFGSENLLTRFDMSDFMESHAISKLIGAPPGYVGFENGGMLVKTVRSRPRQILLFDEIEKAHHKIFDIFLQIFEDGTLRGPHGELADFRHCIVIMTSNIGSDELFGKSRMGFGETCNSEDSHQNTSLDNNKIENLLMQTFRPEFINRLDEIICFNPLTHIIVNKIIERMLTPLHTLLAKQGTKLKIDESVTQLLQHKYFKSESGARSIRKGIRVIEDTIAEILLKSEVEKNHILCITADKEQFYVTQLHESEEDFVYDVSEFSDAQPLSV